MDLKTEMVEEPQANAALWRRMMNRYGNLTGKLSAAVIDQALYAGSNFILNVLLARWMEPSQYGAFVVAYSWFLLPQNFYDAILIEPMSIFGSGRYLKKLREYLGFVYHGHVYFSLIAVVVLLMGAAVSHVTDSAIVGTALLGVAVATPMMLSRWLTRQPLYIRSQPNRSAMGGALYLVLSIAAIFLVEVAGLLNPFTAMFTIGMASLAASTFLTLAFIKPTLRLQRDDDLNWRGLTREHWGYARWSILSRAMNWISVNIYYVLLPILLGLSGSAALRALVNFSMPMSMAIGAVLTLLLPMFVRAYENEGKAALTGKVRMAMTLLVGVSLLYILALALFGQTGASLLYRGQFDEFATFWVMVTLGLSPLAASVNVVLDAALRAMGQVRLAFFAQVASATVTLTLGIVLMATLGLLGVNIAIGLSSASAGVVQWWFYRKQK